MILEPDSYVPIDPIASSAAPSLTSRAAPLDAILVEMCQRKNAKGRKKKPRVAAASKAVAPARNARKPLVDDSAGLLKTIAVMLYCHFSVTLLCLNVLFDLIAFGVPTFVLRLLGVLSPATFFRIANAIIDWTTPTVYFMPMVLSGTTVHCNDVDLVVEAKATDSLLLSNHGSRIDWMVGMFVGHARSIAGRVCDRIRVGFVCEAIIQFMPLVGWYRKIVCDDVFVWRTFRTDSGTIRRNIRSFHVAGERRMLFLSPEGVVVDFGHRDREYIQECRRFCEKDGRQPFEYVLTPRYKGTTSLLEQVRHGGPVVSVCIAYVKDGKLLNCELTSSDRVVPDIYLLNQGIAGSPVDMYIDVKRMPAPVTGSDVLDTKALLMGDYQRKDKVLAEWKKEIERGVDREEWLSRFQVIEGNACEALICQVAHMALIIAVALVFGRIQLLMKISAALFTTIVVCHTVGWLMNSTSMESVPFETGIKALVAFIIDRRQKKTKQE